MATDSLRSVDDEFSKRIHSNRGSGRLHKGHSITAATASIPSQYQTIVIDNAERKGFLSRTKRFNAEFSVSDHPGPGNYVNHGKMDKLSPSYSKKGTGGFASKDRRLVKHASTCSPGSGAYGLPSYIVTKKDFNQAGATSSFHRPIAVNVRDDKHHTPAPNQYEVLKANTKLGKANNVSADASFKSRTIRDALNLGDAKTKPAPWQYHINEELVKDSVKVPCSSFQSRTERKMTRSPAQVPGPGSYHPHDLPQPAKKLTFPRKHYLCISAPAMALPDSPALPGPGSYELVDYEGPDKHFMSSSVFVSSTSRWTGAPKSAADPGPAHYRPIEGSKQSFIYNAQGRWI